MDIPEEPIRPWSRDKLDLLAKYLRAYSIIMQRMKEKWLKSYAYVDAFAGPAHYEDPETLELVNGSPLVALECEPPFDAYWFIDISPDRVQRLERLSAPSRSSQSIHFVQGDANVILCEQVAAEITYRGFRRGFIFLDPYGLQVNWNTMVRLADSRAFDVFVNFPVMGFNRLLERRRKPDAPTLDLLGRVVGETAWVDDAYQANVDLFGDIHYQRAAFDAEDVAGLYVSQVKQLFGFASVPVVMRNSSNAPLYALFLASHNQTAVKITNEIFGRYDRLRRRGL